jgi:hypothetical protein
VEETQMADWRGDPNSREQTGMPGWVKTLGIVVAVLVLLVVAVMLVGGGGHRPRRHGGAGRDAPPPITQDAPLGVPGDASHTGLPLEGSWMTIAPDSRQRRLLTWNR